MKQELDLTQILQPSNLEFIRSVAKEATYDNDLLSEFYKEVCPPQVTMGMVDEIRRLRKVVEDIQQKFSPSVDYSTNTPWRKS